jgi:hypothetical protein
LAWVFVQIEMPEIAATIYGATINDPFASKIAGATIVGALLREALDADTFDDRVRIGSAMTLTEAVHYAQHHINAARQLET